MKHIVAGCLGICLMLSQVTVNAAPPIAPFRAVYTSTWDELISVTAQATQELQMDANGHYTFDFAVNHGLLKLNEISEFTWPSEQIISMEYHHNQAAMGIPRKKQAFFDWKKNVASNPDANKPWSISITPNTLDKLNYQLQLRADIKAGKPALTYLIVDNGKLKTYQFKIVSNEKIKTPFGMIDTIKVERVRKPNDDRQTTFWLAKKWDYLLVKFKQTENGKLYEINLTSASMNGKAVK